MVFNIDGIKVQDIRGGLIIPICRFRAKIPTRICRLEKPVDWKQKIHSMNWCLDWTSTFLNLTTITTGLHLHLMFIQELPVFHTKKPITTNTGDKQKKIRNMDLPYRLLWA